MSKFTTFAQIIETAKTDLVDKCTECGLCLEDCPIYLHPKFGLSKHSTGHVVGKIKDLLDGGPDSQEAYVMIRACSQGCNARCNVCPEEISIPASFMAGALRLKELGRGATPVSYQMQPCHRYTAGHVLGSLQMKPSEVPWVKDLPENPEPVDVVLFISCGTLGNPSMAMDAIDILTKMGINFLAIGGDDLCCGWISLMQGEIEEGQRLAQKYVSTMNKLHPKKVLTTCPGCAMVANMMLTKCFPVGFHSETVTEFLHDNLEKLEFTNPLDKVITCQDSCNLRTGRQWEVPRKLLQAIPGVTLVDMEHNRDNAICCGGATSLNYPQALMERRFAIADEAKAAGADVIAGWCEGCGKNLYGMEEYYPFKVQNVISVVAEAMGVHHEDMLKKYVLMKDVSKVLVEAKEFVEASDFCMAELEEVLPDFFKRMCIYQGPSERAK